MNTAPGPSGRNDRGIPAKPSPWPERAAAPRANGTTKKEAKRLTERREGESSDGVYIKRRRVAGTTDQPPPQAAGGCAQSQKVKAPINAVIRPLTVRRTADTDGTPDNPRPLEPSHKPTDKNPDADSLNGSSLACPRASGLKITARLGPGTGSRQKNAAAGNAQATAHTEWRTENGADVMTAATIWLGERTDGLTREDVHNLNAVLGHAMADNTKTNYRSQWRRFAEWARAKGVSALPADSPHVAAYLAERIEREDHRPATLRTAVAVIAYIHRAAGLANPCAAAVVRRALSGATRKAGRMQKQADALTADALALIQATACQPRLGRGGRWESRTTAWRRGRVDVALISLMRDAMLRVSEAAGLT